jgi:hypothetical protein
MATKPTNFERVLKAAKFGATVTGTDPAKTLFASLVAAVLAAGSAPAATISLNPVPLVKAMHRKASPTTRARRISEALLIGLTIADYRTTMRGMDRGFCETNQRLVGPDGCRINEPKFTRAKIGVASFAFAQELPIWRRHQEGWNRVFLISNITLSIPLAKGVINNYRVLTR